jgi:hypothetical protein
MFRHDFVWCPCKAVAVDGGQDYQRLVFTDDPRNIIHILDDDTEVPYHVAQ